MNQNTIQGHNTHSRKKRFVSFPKGSTLTVKNEAKIVKYSNSWKNLALFVGLPISLDLPEGKLTAFGTNLIDSTKEIPNYSDMYPNYNRDDYEMNHYYGYGRSLGRQRKTGFEFIEQVMDRFGLPGHSCLLKAICDNADTPALSLGMFGEMLSMFLSAGYGDGGPDLKDYVAAEEEGRKNGSCSHSYTECPFHVMDFLFSGISFFHSGFANLDA